MTEALGRSQVFEYLMDLSKTNKIYLISFERNCDINNLREIEILSKQKNIDWKYFNYSNRFGVFSTLIQVFQAVKYASQIIKNNQINIIHSRSMIPATMSVLLRKFYKVKHLFDIRGFVFDEKVDSGRLKNNGFLHKMLIKLECYLYKNSDYVVTLTQKSKEIVIEKYNLSENNIDVISTCANRNIFKSLPTKEKLEFKLSLGFNNEDIILIHTGAVTNSYDFDSEVKVFKALYKLNRHMKFLVVNQGQHKFINEKFQKFGIDKNIYKVFSSSFENVHKYLSISNASIFFIPPTYSKQASSPTKFAENLLCHLPSITNNGVGDMEYYMNQFNVGFIFDLTDVESNLETLLPTMFQVLSTNKGGDFDLLFDKYFDKEVAVEKYDKIYKKLVSVVD